MEIFVQKNAATKENNTVGYELRRYVQGMFDKNSHKYKKY